MDEKEFDEKYKNYFNKISKIENDNRAKKFNEAKKYKTGKELIAYETFLLIESERNINRYLLKSFLTGKDELK